MENEYGVLSALVRLCSCAVNKRKPDAQLLEGTDLNDLYTEAMNHGLASTVCFALEAAGIEDDRFIQAKAHCMRNTVLRDMEYKRITGRFEELGIWYLPLKGALLKDDYPAFAMREMADYDILCDSERMSDVRAVMESFGFTCTEFEESYHDAYEKPPALEFEMHRKLADKTYPKPIVRYYSDIESKLLKDNDKGFGRHFSPEDFYVYLLAHEYKHYSNAGTGLRSLLDIYVFWKKHGEALDKEILGHKLRETELTEFEAWNRELAFGVFTNGEISDEAYEKLGYFIESGTYGNSANSTYNSLYRHMDGLDSAKAKRRHILERIFLTGEEIEDKYPFFHRHKILLPLLFVFRVFRGVFVHPKGVISDLMDIKRFKVKGDNDE